MNRLRLLEVSRIGVRFVGCSISIVCDFNIALSYWLSLVSRFGDWRSLHLLARIRLLLSHVLLLHLLLLGNVLRSRASLTSLNVRIVWFVLSASICLGLLLPFLCLNSFSLNLKREMLGLNSVAHGNLVCLVKALFD